MYSVETQSTFRRNISFPSLRSKISLARKQHEAELANYVALNWFYVEDTEHHVRKEYHDSQFYEKTVLHSKIGLDAGTSHFLVFHVHDKVLRKVFRSPNTQYSNLNTEADNTTR